MLAAFFFVVLLIQPIKTSLPNDCWGNYSPFGDDTAWLIGRKSKMSGTGSPLWNCPLHYRVLRSTCQIIWNFNHYSLYKGEHDEILIFHSSQRISFNNLLGYSFWIIQGKWRQCVLRDSNVIAHYWLYIKRKHVTKQTYIFDNLLFHNFQYGNSINPPFHWLSQQAACNKCRPCHAIYYGLFSEKKLTIKTPGLFIIFKLVCIVINTLHFTLYKVFLIVMANKRIKYNLCIQLSRF